MFSREARVRIFLALLILVLVLTNSQSLQVSYQSRGVLSELFESRSRETALRIVSDIGEGRDEAVSVLSARLENLAKHRELISICVLDWTGRLVAGGACGPPESDEVEALTRVGFDELRESGWMMSEVAPAYDVDRARAFAYLVLPSIPQQSAVRGILRIEVPAPRLAEANRRFRTTLIYQVSALSLVFLAIVLFLNSLLAPQRRLVAEARSVLSELRESGIDETDESEFLLTTFQEVVARLKEKERELSGLHQLEKARADETEALASDIIRSMTTGLVSLDPSGTVVLVNPAAERIFGLEAAKVLKLPFAEVFPGSPALAARADEALQHGAYHLRGQALYKKEGGETLHLGVSVIPLLASDGGPRGAICLFADLTEIVELRERLLLKENLARLGEMVAGIAHEFRNGLGTIMGNAKLLKQQGGVESEELADGLLEESHALARVVTEFLQFARPESLQLEAVDLGALVRDLLDELKQRAERDDVHLSLEADGVISLPADEPMLRKAIWNLVVNAIEAVAGSESKKGWVRVELACNGNFATIRVIDDGPGVEDSEREKIFTPFTTGKVNGTGLGLSVVQKIIVSHNGTVELEKTDGGASFAIRLPVTGDTPEYSEDWL